MLVRLATLVALAGCAADPTYRGHASEDAWTTIPGGALQLRVSKLVPPPGTITAVALPATASESPTGPATEGTRLPIALAGLACEVEVTRRVSELVTRSTTTPDDNVRRTTPAGTRELRGLGIVVRCGDQAVPGSDASLRGARARRSLVWAALVFVLAILAGELARRDRTGLAWAVGLVAVIGGAVLGIVLFEDLFRVTHAVLYAGVALLGAIAMRGDSVTLRAGSLAGVAIGLAIAPLIWPLWIAFGPIAALLFAVAGGALGASAVVLIKG